jgi:hypothetical protein
LPEGGDFQRRRWRKGTDYLFEYLWRRVVQQCRHLRRLLFQEGQLLRELMT